jgi:hypothetical protein
MPYSSGSTGDYVKFDGKLTKAQSLALTGAEAHDLSAGQYGAMAGDLAHLPDSDLNKVDAMKLEMKPTQLAKLVKEQSTLGTSGLKSITAQSLMAMENNAMGAQTGESDSGSNASPEEERGLLLYLAAYMLGTIVCFCCTLACIANRSLDQQKVQPARRNSALVSPGLRYQQVDGEDGEDGEGDIGGNGGDNSADGDI